MLSFKMGKAKLLFSFSYAFLVTLSYFGMLQLALYNTLAHDKDEHLEGHLNVIRPRNTLSLEKIVTKENKTLEFVEDGIFWSDLAESFVPAGSTFENSNRIVSYLRSQDVKSLKIANKTDCGARDNGIVILGDGTRICVRYRHDVFRIQGEALAFYLSRMLKMDNVPEIFLTTINNSTSLWKQLNFSILSWKEDKTVAMVKWIPDTRQRYRLHPFIKEAYNMRIPITNVVINSSEVAEDPASIAQLIQLGTSIIFDYLICQRDRLQQWQIFHKNRFGNILIHNAVQSPNGKIWLIDNESSFACQVFNHSQATKLMRFHNRMLKTMCVFQRSIVAALQALSEEPSAFKTLLSYSKSFEPLLKTVYLETRYRSNLFASQFDGRLTKLMKWIKTCKEKYSVKVDS